jgi:hypothetical protein
MNTDGRIVVSATLAGKMGTKSSGGYFEFNSGGLELFTGSASATFTFDDGRSVTIKLSNCKHPKSVKIFK